MKTECPHCSKVIDNRQFENHINQHEQGIIRTKKRKTFKSKEKKLNRKGKYKHLSHQERKEKLIEEGIIEPPKDKITLAEKKGTVTVKVNLKNISFDQGQLLVIHNDKTYSYCEKHIKPEYNNFLSLYRENVGDSIILIFSNHKLEWNKDLSSLLNIIESNYHNKYSKKCPLCSQFIMNKAFREHLLICQEYEIQWKEGLKLNYQQPATTPILEKNVDVTNRDSSQREKLLDICMSISQQRQHEKYCKLQSIGRLVLKDQKTGKIYLWWLYNDISKSHTYIKDLAGRVVGVNMNPNHLKVIKGSPVSKNSKLIGDLLTSEKAETSMKNQSILKLKNRSNYQSNPDGNTWNIMVRHLISGKKKEKEITWGTLKGLIEASNEIKRKYRYQINDKELVSFLNEKLVNISIEKLFKDAKPFIKDSIRLRNQDILEKEQESVKRSHIFDDITIVIDGGPGTGKTTSLIQRMRFLSSPVAIREYISELSEDKITKDNQHSVQKLALYSLLSFLPTI